MEPESPVRTGCKTQPVGLSRYSIVCQANASVRSFSLIILRFHVEI
jgi:hypothetical protein